GCAYCHVMKPLPTTPAPSKKKTRGSVLSEKMNDRMTALKRRLREIRGEEPRTGAFGYLGPVPALVHSDGTAMPQTRTARAPVRAARSASRRVRARPSRFPRIRAILRFLHKALLVLLALPLAIRIIVAAVLLIAVWSAANWTYQVIRKPTELFFPVSGSLSKTPSETWRQYAPLFREHATAVMTPELLAALAQVEGAGNPVARTDWRSQLSWNPFRLYRPASSAVGMYQITDPTFLEARRFCIHDHVVVETGPWHEWRSCWFN